mmetsp:Transcript_119565/g.244535  ORF Transcript_119565/g.244535 Transcript_119565/m.244535 type:complete len:95 (+) Transcript_119565:219-503(+)
MPHAFVSRQAYCYLPNRDSICLQVALARNDVNVYQYKNLHRYTCDSRQFLLILNSRKIYFEFNNLIREKTNWKFQEFALIEYKKVDLICVLSAP